MNRTIKEGTFTERYKSEKKLSPPPPPPRHLDPKASFVWYYFQWCAPQCFPPYTLARTIILNPFALYCATRVSCLNMKILLILIPGRIHRRNLCMDGPGLDLSCHWIPMGVGFPIYCRSNSPRLLFLRSRRVDERIRPWKG